MSVISSGEASLKIWSCYANFKSSLLISLEIDCFHGLLTRKYLHSMNCRAGFATGNFLIGKLKTYSVPIYYAEFYLY
jgi:hypothetical protein